MKFILLLTFFNFCSFFAMQKLPLDIIAFIAAQPGTIIIEEPNSKNSTVAVQKNCLQKFNNLYKQFIPAINLLFTCKSYYNDDLKIKVKNFLMNRSIPQGLLIRICPKYITYEVFVENENYEKTANLSETLIDICAQKKPITDDEIHQKIASFCLSPNQLDFIVYMDTGIGIISRTLVEYLYFAIKYTETALMKTSIKNIFLVIEYLCKEKKIDLELPIVKDNTKSIEQYIVELYTSQADNLTDVSLPCIKIVSEKYFENKQPKSIYERPDEDPVAIGKIADLFLFSKYQNSLQKEESMIRAAEEKLKQRKEEELKQRNYLTLNINFKSRLVELRNAKTQKNRRRSLKKIFFLLLSITCIAVHCYL